MKKGPMQSRLNTFLTIFLATFPFFVGGLLTTSLAHSQTNLDLDSVTLEDLLDTKISVATKNELSLRETPGVVSVITDKDIRQMGARDLIDVLRTVPGFQFAYDVQGVVSLGVRGLWSAEGKHLLIIDDIEMNELQFAGTQYGNDFPVDQIKRIEIIRGPGSAIYGGFAELAVIKITTKSGQDYKGFQSEVTLGAQSHAITRKNLSAAIGGATESGWDYSLAAYIGQAKRGNGGYSGTAESADDGNVYSGEFDFKDADTLEPMQLNFGLKKNSLKLRALYNRYLVNTYTMFGMTKELGQKGTPNQFETLGLHLSHDWKFSESSKLTSQVMWLQQTPWEQTEELAIATYEKNEVVSHRLRPNLTYSSKWQPGENVQMDLLVGVEQNWDTHHIQDRLGWNAGNLERLYFANGSDDVALSSTAAFAQAMIETPELRLTAGARYENPSETNSSFVPRLALTRARKSWHVKALYSQAFRSPVLYNFEYKAGARIFPETSETLEVEFGLALSSTSYLTFNVFDTQIKNPIVYTVDGNEQYENFEKTGTRGVELDFRWKGNGSSLQIGYSYYEVGSSTIGLYAVPGNDKALLGMPQHSGVINGYIELGAPDLKLNPQVLYRSVTAAYDFDGTDMAQRELPATTLVNLFLHKDDLWLSGLSGGVGVFNALGQNHYYAQPYNGGHSPIPGLRAEGIVRLRYNMTF